MLGYPKQRKANNPKPNPEVSKINTNSDSKEDNSKNFNVVEPQFDFVELAPLEYEIENTPRKELSSIPIDQVEFPKVVYMVVDKNIELEIKLLKDYPEWEFLPNEDLNRKTIEIFFDLKTAKSKDGLNWDRKGTIAINFKNPFELYVDVDPEKNQLKMSPWHPEATASFGMVVKILTDVMIQSGIVSVERRMECLDASIRVVTTNKQKSMVLLGDDEDARKDAFLYFSREIRNALA